MRAVVQRVSSARVEVDEEVVGAVSDGLLVLVGAARDDTVERARAMAAKVHGLRILEGERSAADVGAPLLVVSQFTLQADTRKGRRPSWSPAAPAEQAEPLVEEVVAALRAAGADVQTGRFRAQMRVTSVNTGPMTLILDT